MPSLVIRHPVPMVRTEYLKGNLNRRVSDADLLLAFDGDAELGWLLRLSVLRHCHVRHARFMESAFVPPGWAGFFSTGTRPMPQIGHLPSGSCDLTDGCIVQV